MTNDTQQRKPGLFRAASFLFITMMSNNILNYLFHAVASRRLGPADYGALVSMLALLGLIAIPSQAIQIVVAKQTTVEELAGRFDRLSAFVLKMSLVMTVAGGLVWLLMAVGQSFLVSFFHLKSSGPILAVGFTGLVMFMIPIMRGAQQGLQKFNQLGVNLLCDGVVRLGLGSLLLITGLGVAGGVTASGLGGLGALLLAWLVLPEVRKAKGMWQHRFGFNQVMSYALSVLFAFGGYTALSTLDVLMVKHFFVPETAGYYAAASMVGKAFLFLPFAFAHVLFPKVSSSHASGQNSIKLLIRALIYTAVILLVGVAAVWWLAALVVDTLFGSDFLNEQTLQLVKLFALAITPLAITYILIQYYLATHNNRLAILLMIDIPLFFTGLLLFHASLEQVLLVVGINHLCLFIAGCLLLFKVPSPSWEQPVNA